MSNARTSAVLGGPEVRGGAAVTADEVIRYVLAAYPGVVPKRTWGERSLFYNPGGALPSGTYFLTVKEKDGANDAASRLDRAGVYRVNVGVTKGTYRGLFGELPARPPRGGVVATGHDFARLDEVMPHPVYGWGAWIGVLNPSEETWERFKSYIGESYEIARERFARRLRSGAAARR